MNDEFANKMQLDRKSQNISIDGTKFQLEHLCLDSTSQTGHELHLCASNRCVETESLSDHMPGLKGPLTNQDGKPFYYAVCVHNQDFETSTDWERTRMDLVEDRNRLPGEKVVTRQQIYKKVTEASDKYLKCFLEPLRSKNNKRIIEYIEKKEPKYRPLAKHRAHWFDRITPGITDEALSVELYKLSREYETETRYELGKIKRKLLSAETLAGYKDRFTDFLTELNDQGIALLADYVVHRKAILDFLEKSIEKLPNNKYAAEKQIHQLICPMGVESGDIPLDQMNLWVIDERLTFHSYLSSDRQQRTVAPIDSDSQDRSDIILFNHPCVFSDDAYASIVIIEFKRPMRDDYTAEENPISQVYRYVDKLRNEKEPANSRKGRPIPVTPSTPIFAYIICDLTVNLKQFAKDAEFKIMPDRQGFYKYHSEHNVYTEIISFDKLVGDAKKRNAAFFDKLNLPPS